MTVVDDVRRTFEEIAAQPTLGPTATIHHPKCPCAAPVFVTATWARPPTFADCTCGGAAFPVRA